MARLRSAAATIASTTLLVALAGAPAARGEAPAYRHRDSRFEIVVAVAEDAGALRATVTPREPWKLSADFPIRFAVAGGEPVRSEVPVAAEGTSVDLPLERVPSGRVDARISVAVCQGEVCERADHDFELETP